MRGLRYGVLVVAGVATVAAGASARPHRYAIPADTVPASLADADGTLIAGNCLACHSLDYLATQPRGKGAQFWRDELTKMVTVYKAPVAPADTDAVAAALARKFGGA